MIQKQEFALGHLERFCQHIARGLEVMTFEERQQLLRLVIEQVIVDNGKVRIEMVIPTEQVDKLRNRRGELVEPFERKDVLRSPSQTLHCGKLKNGIRFLKKNYLLSSRHGLCLTRIKKRIPTGTTLHINKSITNQFQWRFILTPSKRIPKTSA